MTAPTIVETSAAGSTSVDISWLAAQSSKLGSVGLTYEVHLSETQGFTPSASTLKASGLDMLETRVTGLKLGTTYYVIVAAHDNTQGKGSSVASTVKTAAVDGDLKPGVKFKALDDADVVSFDGLQVQIAASATPPKVGAFLASTKGSGFLRRVTAVRAGGGGNPTTVDTETAALSDVVTSAAVASALAFPAIQVGGAEAGRSRALAVGRDRENGVRQTWPGNRLTIQASGAADVSTVTIDQAVKVTDTINLTYSPTLQTELTLNFVGVNTARIVLGGDLKLEQQLSVTASGSAAIDQTTTVVAPRSITKVAFIGPVPLVYSGQFSADLRIQAQATGAIRATSTQTLNLSDMSLGLTYQNGQWDTLASAKPGYQFTARGEGDAKVTVTATFIPKVQLSLYGAIAGNVAATPNLTAVAAAHGQAAASTNQARTWDADYWLTDVSLSSGMDMLVMGNLKILDRNVLSYPSGATVDKLDTYKQFGVFPQTSLLALPTLAAQADMATKHPQYPNAVRITRTFQNVPNPLSPVGPTSFVTFANWTDVIAKDGANDPFTVVPSPVGGDPNDLWVDFQGAGPHTLRLGAHSSLGTWARQIVELEVFGNADAKDFQVQATLQPRDDQYVTYLVNVTGRVMAPVGTAMFIASGDGAAGPGGFGSPRLICHAWTGAVLDFGQSLMACIRAPGDPLWTTFSVDYINIDGHNRHPFIVSFRAQPFTNGCMVGDYCMKVWYAPW